MPNHVDDFPVRTPIPVEGGILNFLKSQPWVKAFNEVVQALNRPQVTTQFIFLAVPAQSSSDIIVQFPLGSVDEGDLPVLSTLAPPADTCFTVHIAPGDRVVLRFNNYSAIVKGTGIPQNATITVIKK